MLLALWWHASAYRSSAGTPLPQQFEEHSGVRSALTWCWGGLSQRRSVLELHIRLDAGWSLVEHGGCGTGQGGIMFMI